MTPVKIWLGYPYPLGATWLGNGVNFAIFSENATSVDLCLFDNIDAPQENIRIPMTEQTDQVWHVFLPDVRPGQLYGYRVYGPYDPERGMRFNSSKLLIDPYAKAIAGQVNWADEMFGYVVGGESEDLSRDFRDDAWGVPKAAVIDHAFDWGNDKRLGIPLQRERNLNVRLPYYVFSKFMSLGFFALFQCVLFVLIANYILEIRGMFWIDLGIMLMTAMGGVALGLVVSSLVADPKTAANIVPLVLIPQIIMGGALIKYEDMNRNLALVYAFTRWFTEHPSEEQGKKMNSRLQVPFVCQFIAMRWSYEEMVVAQGKLNPLTRRQERVNREMQKIVEQKNQNPENTKRLNDLKEVLAMLSGLEAKSSDQLDRYLALTDDVISGKKPFDREIFKDASGPITAEQLYVNQKVSDLISNAEMEQSDYRRGGKLNVFFGEEKRYFGFKVDLFIFNTFVLIASTLGLLGILHWILRRQLEVRRT